MIMVGNTFSGAQKEANSYWIHEESSVALLNQVNADGISCRAIENVADDITPTEINPTDCTQEKWVTCKVNVHKAPTIPPKFPCISNNQGATKKSKREVESLMEGQHYKEEGEKCKKEYENTLISSIEFIFKT